MIKKILIAAGMGAFFYDDQKAIKEGAKSKHFLYEGSPLTKGFTAIRMPAESLSIGLMLEDNTIVWGDMMSVQYAAAAGREDVFCSQNARSLLQSGLESRLKKIPLVAIRSELEELFLPLNNETPIPLSVQYGISQAILQAHAHIQRITPAEVIAQAYDLPVVANPIPIYAQSGDDRFNNTQKMLLKRVDILPHGLINSPEKFGENGKTFEAFALWVAEQINQLNDNAYHPILHFDVYGNIGHCFQQEPKAIAGYINDISKQLAPFQLHIESPADFGSVEKQIEGYAAIKNELNKLGCSAKIVVDEWCDNKEDIIQFSKHQAADIIQIKTPDVGNILHSVEAALICKEYGVGAHIGGSCSETDISAKLSVHVAVAVQADMILCKPGMGVDEGISIIKNEQNRLISTLLYRDQ